jgi:hypothetical protein
MVSRRTETEADEGVGGGLAPPHFNRSEVPKASVAIPIRVKAPFRLVRDHDKPISHEFEEAYEFGLQDHKGEIVPGARDPIGRFVFDFSLKVKPDANGRPVFTG